MQNSRVLVVDGVFLGAAVTVPETGGWRIVAADTRMASVNGREAANWNEVQHLARQAFLNLRVREPEKQVATAA